MLSFFPRGVLDEILNLIESVSEDFPSYSYVPPPNNVILYGKDNDNVCVFGYFSNLMVKFWQSRKCFYLIMSAVWLLLAFKHSI